MNFRVSISRRAKCDIREIVEWIRVRSSKGALAWLDALESNLSHISSDAPSSTPAAEADDLGLDLRQRLFKTRRGNSYRLVFIIRKDIVHVLAVRGTGQDLLQWADIEIPE